MFNLAAGFRRLLAFFNPRRFYLCFRTTTYHPTPPPLKTDAIFDDSYTFKSQGNNETHIWLPHLLDRKFKSADEDEKDDSDDEVPMTHISIAVL
ncbi:hypothetical protein B0H13DRAFT_2343818 [Mycena leptocephala]|nr:hypothetical protein B0H13DRAFT_2343818 [Mycena leptocephala]